MRVLLAEIGDNMQWDPAKTGALTISNSGKTLTNGTGAPQSTGAGVLLPRSRGKHYLRFRFDVIPGSGIISVGLYSDPRATPGALLGGDFDSWCYRLNAGAATGFHNNATTAALTVVAASGFVDVAVDIDNGLLWFGVNGVWQLAGNPATGASPMYSDLLSTSRAKPARSTDRFYVAASCRSATSSVTLITDYDSCVASCPSGFTPIGEFAYVASQGYCSGQADAPPSRYYDGCIADEGDPVYERGVTTSAWTRGSRTGAPLSSFDLNNNDGALDFWRNYDLRDMPVRWRMGQHDASTSTYETVANTIIEARTSPDERTMRVTMKDKLGLLDRPWTNATLTGSPVTEVNNTTPPFALGRCFWVPLVAYDPANLQYPLVDAEWSEIEEVRDQGVVITQLAGWDASSNANIYGVRRVTNPAGKQVATVKGTTILGAASIGAGTGDFTTWAGGVPSGWTETSPATASNDVKQSGSAAQFLSNGTANVILSIAAALTDNLRYYLEVTVSARTSGRLAIEKTGTGTTVLGYMPATGTYRIPFLAGVAQNTFQIRVPAGESADITVSRVRLYATTTVQRLSDWTTELAVTRGPLLASDLDATAISALQTAAPYTLCYYTQTADRISDILTQTMDSFLGWMWVNRSNLVTVGRLLDPAGQTSLLTLTDIEVYGEVKVDDDLAPGLSTRLSGRRNFSPHEDTDIAASVLNTAVAAQLKQQYLCTTTSATPIAGVYAQAKSADPVPTLLSADADVQTEATRRGALWASKRAFYTFSAFVQGGLGYQLEPGQTITLAIDRYGLDAGRKLMILYVRSRFLSDLVDFVAWG